jgi:hypothetical protein
MFCKNNFGTPLEKCFRRVNFLKKSTWVELKATITFVDGLVVRKSAEVAG